jgi:hypothetical protein
MKFGVRVVVRQIYHTAKALREGKYWGGPLWDFKLFA